MNSLLIDLQLLNERFTNGLPVGKWKIPSGNLMSNGRFGDFKKDGDS